MCAEPTHLTKLATPGPRRKKLPPNLPTPQVPAALLAQVSALPQGQPTNTLNPLHLTYDAGYSKTLTASTGKPFVQKFECSVGESFPAAQHVASLLGLARNVTCSAGNGLKSSSTYLFLEACDLFVKTAERSMLLVQVRKFKAAQ